MYWPSKNMREVIKELQVSGGQWFEGGGGGGEPDREEEMSMRTSA